jgi:DNA-binding XRE family transcriptional regulator
MVRRRRHFLSDEQRRELGRKMSDARQSIDPMFSQAAMGRLIGVSKDTVERWETGQKQPEADELARYCQRLISKQVDDLAAREIFKFAYPDLSFELPNSSGAFVAKSVKSGVERLGGIFEAPTNPYSEQHRATAAQGKNRLRTPNEREARLLAEPHLIEEAFRNAETMRTNSALYDYLEAESKWRAPMYLDHPHQMMIKSFPGRLTVPIPISVLSLASKIRLSALGDDLSDREVRQNAYFRMVYEMTDLNARKNKKSAEDLLWNGRVYTMRDISNSGDGRECIIHGGVSDFFSTLTHHVSMEFELLSELKERQTTSDLSLPTRQHFFEKQLRQRQHAALSITALVVYKSARSGGYKIMLCKRSEQPAVYRGLFGIIPGGMFQPEVSPLDEWNIHHCIIKEFTEELFGADFDRERASPFYFFYNADEKWKHAAALYRAFKDGECKLIHSGVLLTMLDWLPQICCVLLIEEPSWYARLSVDMKNNFENLSRTDFMRSIKAAMTDEFDLDDFESQFLELAEPATTGPAISGRWVPASLGSLWLGIAAVREYFEKKRPSAEFIPYLSKIGLPDPN